MSNEYKVGDEAELGPVRMSKFLADVASQGGLVEIVGNKAKVVYMPKEAEDAKTQTNPKAEKEEPAKKATRSRSKQSSSEAGDKDSESDK